jgi:hypothetical protein
MEWEHSLECPSPSEASQYTSAADMHKEPLKCPPYLPVVEAVEKCPAPEAVEKCVSSSSSSSSSSLPVVEAVEGLRFSSLKPEP